MPRLNRLACRGRLMALAAALYPTFQDVTTEALANVCTDKVPALPVPGWLAIALSLVAGVALGKVPGLVEHGARWLVALRRSSSAGDHEPAREARFLRLEPQRVDARADSPARSVAQVP